MTRPVAERAVESVFRAEWGRVTATLVRDIGDLDLAEDAVQEALEVALGTWPIEGVPDRPGAWITATARRKAIDRLRRDVNRARKQELLARLESRPVDEVGSEEDPTVIADDQLRLIFTCCHPALSTDAQIALTLRSLCGLTTAEIARGFVVPEPTMA